VKPHTGTLDGVIFFTTELISFGDAVSVSWADKKQGGFRKNACVLKAIMFELVSELH